MFTLHQFYKAEDGQNMSPFCLKLECWFQHMKVPYKSQEHLEPGKMPKQKLPVLEDQGRLVPDSEFALEYLRDKHGLDADDWMDRYQRSIAHSFKVMAEERLYWIIVWQRWAVDENWQQLKAIFFGKLPPVLKDVIAWRVRKNVLQNLMGQGLTRHAGNEIVSLAKRDIDAIEAQLADKPYLMGDRFCSADAAVFGILQNLRKPFDTELARDINSRPGLVAWLERLETPEDDLRQAA